MSAKFTKLDQWVDEKGNILRLVRNSAGMLAVEVLIPDDEPYWSELSHHDPWRYKAVLERLAEVSEEENPEVQR